MLYLQHLALCNRKQRCRMLECKLTIGSTSFTPLSTGGLWLAVIITPIT